MSLARCWRWIKLDTVYTVPQVAEYLQISPSKLYLMIQKGEMPHVKIGKNVRILESDLTLYIEQMHRPAKQMGLRFPEG
jgi:excisionase family DNA binding protein